MCVREKQKIAKPMVIAANAAPAALLRLIRLAITS
ncbi:hypothetical protein HNQ69_000412 [Bartonella callosciuri]|uniref:Uncharacterized protein n=1 Tax=Bartonella callosciuri TaxID=686223 RepID=A0A840NSD3_9HYPH|nr:hypothetical protein [Bartonella callosciuri]